MPFGVSSHSPYGSVSVRGLNTYYNPVDNQAIDNLSNQALNTQMSVLSGLPSNMGYNPKLANHIYNQLFTPTYNALSGPLMQQFQMDNQNLMNQLSAQNQFGSSYAALRQDMLGRQQAQQLMQAGNMAQSQSLNNANTLAMDNVNSRVANSLNTLQALQMLRNASFNQQLAGMQLLPLGGAGSIGGFGGGGSGGGFGNFMGDATMAALLASKMM